jgi:hypothetical protein
MTGIRPLWIRLIIEFLGRFVLVTAAATIARLTPISIAGELVTAAAICEMSPAIAARSELNTGRSAPAMGPFDSVRGPGRL